MNESNCLVLRINFPKIILIPLVTYKYFFKFVTSEVNSREIDDPDDVQFISLPICII